MRDSGQAYCFGAGESKGSKKKKKSKQSQWLKGKITVGLFLSFLFAVFSGTLRTHSSFLPD